MTNEYESASKEALRSVFLLGYQYARKGNIYEEMPQATKNAAEAQFERWYSREVIDE